MIISNMRHKILTAAVAVAALCTPQAYAWDLKDLLGGDAGNTIGNIIEGVFSKTDLEVKDLAGVWRATGSAVTFKSDNFLQKAGGIAGAAAIETKINPYFEQYGLTGSVMTITASGEMSLKIKNFTLKGNVVKGAEEGTFEFDFNALGAIKIATLTAYVEKSPSSLNVMFDATKLKQFISVVAKISGMQLAQTLSSVLESYDGACIGFKMEHIGDAPATLSSGTTNLEPKSKTKTTTKTTTKDNKSTEPTIENGLDRLRNLLGGSKK